MQHAANVRNAQLFSRIHFPKSYHCGSNQATVGKARVIEYAFSVKQIRHIPHFESILFQKRVRTLRVWRQLSRHNSADGSIARSFVVLHNHRPL